MAARKIVTAVGSAVGQGVLTGLWTAAGELSPAKRRVLRFASGAGVAAFGFLTAKRDEKGDQASGEEPDRKVEWAEVDKRRLAMTAGATLLGIGSMIGRRHLEKRWLAALQESGHPHPYRALGVRMGLVAAALALPGALRERR